MKSDHAEALDTARKLLAEAALTARFWGLETTYRDIVDANGTIARVLREDPAQ